MDLHVGQVLPSAFELEATFSMTDLMFDELRAPTGARLREWGLKVKSLDGDAVEQIIALGSTHMRPSRPDLSGLYLAKRMNATLLTGDAALRAAAETEDVEVHGTLWLMDRLVLQSVLSPREAGRALQLMDEDPDRWLPRQELRARVRRWMRE